uniref:Uncharacterized protein n=1 Tax=Clandestinovirus TaxID=2831644 RepID=A0A8F8KQZ5_9VIRU|nr:hypothetical protein KOM_12_137 [Clandestinovirus]
MSNKPTEVIQVSWDVYDGSHCVMYFSTMEDALKFTSGGHDRPNFQYKTVSIMNDVLMVLDAEVKGVVPLWECGCDECQS